MNTIEIQQAIQNNGTLAVYQLAILDYLNAATTAADIAGIEPSAGPISDDPDKRGRGYDIGLKVAERILQRRAALGGTFKRLEDLADIPYFGEDKIHDLIYTYMKLKSPIPTGLGQEFDNFILALSQLEIAALRLNYDTATTLGAVRKIFFDKQIPSQDQERTIKLNWDKVIPKSTDSNPPSNWIIRSSHMAAMDFIEKHPVVQIGAEKINVHTLIAGLDAKSHPDKVNTGHSQLILDSNLAASTLLMELASTAYQYLSPFSIGANQGFEIVQEDLNDIYNNEMTLASYRAIADAYHMAFDPERSLSWNLLNYYTNKDNLTKHRYQHLASTLNLGTYTDGIFSNDKLETRQAILDGIRTNSFFLLKENNRTQLVNRMLQNGEGDGSYDTYQIASAYVLDLFIDRLAILVGIEINKPTIISWNRLEARPRTEDFSRTLKAEVRDALWFISRQWQFGEFNAEDAGSALEMRVDMQTSKVDRFSLRGQAAKNFEESIPMETTVEREPVYLDLTLRQEMGKHFERLLQQKLSASPGGFAQSTINNIINDFRNQQAFKFTLPSPSDQFPEIYSNYDLVKNYAAISEGRMLDGGTIYSKVKGGEAASTFVSSTSSVNALARVDDAGNELLDWFERVYSQPENTIDSAWNPKQLEYQFHCSVPNSPGARSVLSTTEYAHGHLDWYNFDVETNSNNYNASLTNGAIDPTKVHRKLITVLPTDLKYPGMPLARWWQFEDFKVDLGDIKANTNELPKLLMTEFALIYSNDWMLVPFDVAVGSLCAIKNIVVRDVFGQYTAVDAAGAGDNTDWQRWTMFNLKRKDLSAGTADTRLFVPPAVVRTMESDPVERVGLLRDEMANMVWGIEKLVPDGLGGAMDGGQAGNRLHDYLVSITPDVPDTNPSDPPVINDATIRYKLGTTVPENWIPFIPVRLGSVNSRKIQLRRAAMPRIIKGRTPERIRPRTTLLKTGYDTTQNTWGPYFLHEEEVPRSGVIIERKWQRTRWRNGKVYTWLGRKVSNGRGEANSGLEFDLVLDKK